MITLKQVLKLNAASCLMFGSLFVLMPSSIAVFLSESQPLPSLLILVTGVVLLLNGGHLLWAAYQSKPSRHWIFYFSAGDFLWVLATLVLVIGGFGVTTTLGIVTALVIALVVAELGIMQLVTLRKETQP